MKTIIRVSEFTKHSGTNDKYKDTTKHAIPSQFYLQEVEKLYYQHLTCPPLTFSAKCLTNSLQFLIINCSNYISLILERSVPYIS